MSNWREMLKEAKELFDDGFIDADEYKELKAEALAVRSQEKKAGKSSLSDGTASDTFAGKTSFSGNMNAKNSSDTFGGGTRFHQGSFDFPQSGMAGDSISEIGQYLLVEEIGVGGMGNVYRAKHKIEAFALQTGDVAIKLMKPELALNEEFRNRFIAEASTGRSLSHPNICKIYDVIPEKDGRLGLVMEFLEGKELQELIPDGGMDIEKALPLIKQIVAGVEYLHTEKVIHRDLKPENIMVSSKGEVKILDMGIAKNTAQENTSHTQTGTALGTPLYMAPEQLNAKNVQPSADAYAVGLIVYKMLSGHLPWPKNSGAGDILAAKFGGQLKPFEGKNAFVAPIVMEMLSVMVGARPSLSGFLKKLSVSPEKQRQALEKESLRAMQIWADRLERQVKELSDKHSKDKSTLLALANLDYRKKWMERSEDWKARLEKAEQIIPKILQQRETREKEQKELEKALKEQAAKLEELLKKSKQELKDVPEFQKFAKKLSFQRKSRESLEKWEIRLQELGSSLPKSIEQGQLRLIEIEKEKEQEKIRLEQARIKLEKEKEQKRIQAEEAKKEAEKNKKRVAELEQQLIKLREGYSPIIEKDNKRIEQLQERISQVKKEVEEAVTQKQPLETEIKTLDEKRAQITSRKSFYQEQIQKKEVELETLKNTRFVLGKQDKLIALQNDIHSLKTNLKLVTEFEVNAPSIKREILERRKSAQKVVTAKQIFLDGLVHSQQELQARISQQEEQQRKDEEPIISELQQLAKKGKAFHSRFLNANRKPKVSSKKTTKKKKKQEARKLKNLREMVLIPRGDFLMGAVSGDFDAEIFEHPQHSVHISRGFWMGRYPVTQDLWEDVMGSNPSKFKGEDHPVERVSWFDCLRFCNALSEKKGLQAVYTIKGPSITCNWNASGYRLPTEAEWEYAARGGRTDHIFAGLNDSDAVAWFSKNAEKTTHPVGEKRPNGFGLYDMSGNVWEWCWDIFDKNAYKNRRSGQPDPRGPASGKERINRGGCWYSAESGTRVSFRCGDQPFIASSYIGLRIVRVDK